MKPSVAFLPSAVGLLLAGSVLALGTVHTTVLVVLAVLSLGLLAAAAFAFGQRRPWAVPLTVLAAALAAYSLLQALPLPASWVRVLSPESAAVWARPLLSTGGAPSVVSLSVDRGASLVEALRWVVYAVAFQLGARLGHRRLDHVVLLVFGSALALGVITLLHGLFGAHAVYGFFDQSFEPARWTTSPLVNANNLSGYLNLGAFAGLGLLLTSRQIPARWGIAVGSALLMGQSVLCASRAGVGTLLLGLLGLTLWAFKSTRRVPRAQRWGALGAAGLAVAGGLSLALLGASRTTWLALREEGLEKLDLARDTLELIAAFPVWGSGAGTFETAFPPYRTTPGHLTWNYAENFALNSVSDWGLPVGLATLCLFAWLLRPSRLEAGKSNLARSLYVGTLVLSAQNLFDVGFSVPGVFIAAAVSWGGLWGAATPSPRVAPRYAAPLLFGLGALALVLVLWRGAPSADDDRKSLKALYEETNWKDAAQVATLRAELDAATERHPGDPFLPSLAGAIAVKTNDARALAWAVRALERDDDNGATHFLLAQILRGRGYQSQALLHLRLAAQAVPGWTAHAAAAAIGWTQDDQALERLVPPGPAGASMLTELGVRLPSPERRLALLQQAVSRDQRSIGARAALISELIRELSDPKSPCHAAPAPCARHVEDHLTKLEQLKPEGDTATTLRGQMLSALGRQQEARDYLDAHCNRRELPCLQALISAAFTLPAFNALDQPAAAYLGLACPTPEQCAAAESWLGDLYAARRNWGAALRHYASAAEQAPGPTAWLRVADAAHELGSRSQVLVALKKAEQLGAPPEELTRRRDRQEAGP